MKFAVLDVETSGFGKTDRILEIGIVLIDNLEVIDEFETVINPLRDVSNANIHGLDASILSLAPTFEDIYPKISALIDGRILVAHNLPFDQRMISQELGRFSDNYDLGQGICTLKLTGKKLIQASLDYGIELKNVHSALADARATAQIFSRLQLNFEGFAPCAINYPRINRSTRTLVRPEDKDSLESKTSFINRLNASIDIQQLEQKKIYYFDELSRALADLVISDKEEKALNELANVIGIDTKDRLEVHHLYLDQLMDAAKRDGFISDYEQQVIDKIAKLLSIEHSVERTPSGEDPPEATEGIRVCFTGTARDKNGVEISRAQLENLALTRGFIAVDSVTKKNCDLLVASDVNSMSGKTKKARNLGIPVISVEQFLQT